MCTLRKGIKNFEVKVYIKKGTLRFREILFHQKFHQFFYENC